MISKSTQTAVNGVVLALVIGGAAFSQWVAQTPKAPQPLKYVWIGALLIAAVWLIMVHWMATVEHD